MPALARRFVVAKYSLVRKLGAFHLIAFADRGIDGQDQLAQRLDVALVRVVELRHEVVHRLRRVGRLHAGTGTPRNAASKIALSSWSARLAPRAFAMP